MCRGRDHGGPICRPLLEPLRDEQLHTSEAGIPLKMSFAAADLGLRCLTVRRKNMFGHFIEDLPVYIARTMAYWLVRVPAQPSVTGQAKRKKMTCCTYVIPHSNRREHYHRPSFEFRGNRSPSVMPWSLPETKLCAPDYRGPGTITFNPLRSHFFLVFHPS
ncbi:hypothetical protein B0H11DRAFT_2078251 [Mycena galericulata]|nr:hypothetical protein B0H11DRAFT_2078251 [Mycena galericulata]